MIAAPRTYLPDSPTAVTPWAVSGQEYGNLDRTNYPQGHMDPYGYFFVNIPDYQGNIIGVYNAATGGLDQFTDYYPYGQPHPDCTAPELNRRKFGAKEFMTSFGLNEYDFDARRLSPNNLFTQPDPFASKYPWLSPYSYCTADPINFIDPTGLILNPSANFRATQIENEARNQINVNEELIRDLMNQLTQEGLTPAQMTVLANDINRLISINNALFEALIEIKILRASTQYYKVGQWSENYGYVSIVPSTGEVIIMLPPQCSLYVIAHEFKHAYQFEIGRTSFFTNKSITQSVMSSYDKYDEVEAYRRGELFGGPHFSINTLPDIYSHAPRGLYSITPFLDILSSDKNIINIYRITGVAFRYNGKTYY